MTGVMIMAKKSTKKAAKKEAKVEQVGANTVMKKIVTVLQGQVSGKSTAEVALACGWPADAVVAVAYLNTEMGKLRKAKNDQDLEKKSEGEALPTTL
jgi:hypothetical protein